MEQELALKKNEDKLLGITATCEHRYDETEEEETYRDGQFEQFSKYLWGVEDSLEGKLGTLRRSEYGKDINLILFQYHVFPSDFSKAHIRAIEPYSSREKAVGLSVIVTEQNFFDKSKTERRNFLANTVVNGVDLLREMVKTKGLDTNMSKLMQDIQRVLMEYSGRSQTIVADSTSQRSLVEPLQTEDLSVGSGEQSLVVTASFRSGESVGTKQEEDELIRLEQRLRRTLENVGGDVDGHDIGEGRFNIYIYGDNLGKLQSVVEPVLANSVFDNLRVTVQ